MGIQHTVQQGECFTRIATRYGFRDYKTIYNHPDNAALKKKRPDPNVLYPGDRIAIPDLQLKKVACATAKDHPFKVKRARQVLKLVLQTATGDPMKDTAYRLELDSGQVLEGKTGGDGSIEVDVPAGSNQATLTVDDADRTLSFGQLDPAKDAPDGGVRGVQERLVNLGYAPGPLDGIAGRWTKAAVQAFQRDQGIDPDGELTPALAGKIVAAHGC